MTRTTQPQAAPTRSRPAVAAAGRSSRARADGERLETLFRPTVAYPLLVVAAVGYSVVALLLAFADARAMPEPFLRIDAGEYFRWGVAFYTPVILTA